MSKHNWEWDARNNPRKAMSILTKIVACTDTCVDSDSGKGNRKGQWTPGSGQNTEWAESSGIVIETSFKSWYTQLIMRNLNFVSALGAYYGEYGVSY